MSFWILDSHLSTIKSIFKNEKRMKTRTTIKKLQVGVCKERRWGLIDFPISFRIFLQEK